MVDIDKVGSGTSSDPHVSEAEQLPEDRYNHDDEKPETTPQVRALTARPSHVDGDGSDREEEHRNEDRPAGVHTKRPSRIIFSSASNGSLPQRDVIERTTSPDPHVPELGQTSDDSHNAGDGNALGGAKGTPPARRTRPHHSRRISRVSVSNAPPNESVPDSRKQMIRRQSVVSRATTLRSNRGVRFQRGNLMRRDTLFFDQQHFWNFHLTLLLCTIFVLYWIGTGAFYALLDDSHDIVKSMYFTSILLGFTGYGDVPITSVSGRTFLCFYAIVGIAVMYTINFRICFYFRVFHRDTWTPGLRILYSYAFLVFLTLLGTGLMVAIEDNDRTFLDSLYLVSQTVSAVGFGDVVPTTDQGKLFAGLVLSMLCMPFYSSASYNVVDVLRVSYIQPFLLRHLHRVLGLSEQAVEQLVSGRIQVYEDKEIDEEEAQNEASKVVSLSKSAEAMNTGQLRVRTLLSTGTETSPPTDTRRPRLATQTSASAGAPISVHPDFSPLDDSGEASNTLRPPPEDASAGESPAADQRRPSADSAGLYMNVPLKPQPRKSSLKAGSDAGMPRSGTLTFGSNPNMSLQDMQHAKFQGLSQEFGMPPSQDMLHPASASQQSLDEMFMDQYTAGQELAVAMCFCFVILLLMVICACLFHFVEPEFDWISAWWFTCSIFSVNGYGENDAVLDGRPAQEGVTFVPQGVQAKWVFIAVCPFVLGFQIMCVGIFIQFLEYKDITGRQFILTVLAGIVVALAYFTLLIGSIEGWTIPEGLYFAVISLNTIGLGDVAPATTAGRLLYMPGILGEFPWFLGLLTMATVYVNYTRNWYIQRFGSVQEKQQGGQ